MWNIYWSYKLLNNYQKTFKEVSFVISSLNTELKRNSIWWKHYFSNNFSRIWWKLSSLQGRDRIFRSFWDLLDLDHFVQSAIMIVLMRWKLFPAGKTWSYWCQNNDTCHVKITCLFESWNQNDVTNWLTIDIK